MTSPWLVLYNAVFYPLLAQLTQEIISIIVSHVTSNNYKKILEEYLESRKELKSYKEANGVALETVITSAGTSATVDESALKLKLSVEEKIAQIIKLNNSLISYVIFSAFILPYILGAFGNIIAYPSWRLFVVIWSDIFIPILSHVLNWLLFYQFWTIQKENLAKQKEKKEQKLNGKEVVIKSNEVSLGASHTSF